jgi:tetratricopeptide (TPR) repeat protein
MEEMAETEHLLARLPLHTPIRSGREADAYAISFRHALAAENAYQRLNQPRHLARVWETMGRLEHRQGRLDAAQGRLETAIQLQKKIGDITGLARSAAGLADLYITTNQFEAAATLLMDSVGLNFEKGSPIGLAFNRKTFDVLQKAVRHEQVSRSTRAQELLSVLEEQLVDAESVLGRMALPGEDNATP